MLPILPDNSGYLNGDEPPETEDDVTMLFDDELPRDTPNLNETPCTTGLNHSHPKWAGGAHFFGGLE